MLRGLLNIVVTGVFAVGGVPYILVNYLRQRMEAQPQDDPDEMDYSLPPALEERHDPEHD